MTTLRVEQSGNDLVVRLTKEAVSTLGLRAGDEVVLARSLYGEVSLIAIEMDHQLRIDRGRALLRRLNSAA